MKIAVCISGQLRTFEHCIESIKHFFPECDFFCHTWDYNDYKEKDHKKNKTIRINEQVNIDHAIKLLTSLSPKQFKIDSAQVLTHKFGWNSMLYSNMIAHQMKRRYEILGRFRYDLVIKTRYDLVHEPSKIFTVPNMLTDSYGTYSQSHDLFTFHNDRMVSEYNRVNISDVLYYGSSTAMDIASDLYWYVKYNTEKILSQYDHENLGPGTWMSKYITTNNLRFHLDRQNLREIIFRKSATHLQWPPDWHKIIEKNAEIYK